MQYFVQFLILNLKILSLRHTFNVGNRFVNNFFYSEWNEYHFSIVLWLLIIKCYHAVCNMAKYRLRWLRKSTIWHFSLILDHNINIYVALLVPHGMYEIFIPHYLNILRIFDDFCFKNSPRIVLKIFFCAGSAFFQERLLYAIHAGVCLVQKGF